MDYVDLFAGAGGWDVAARSLGMQGVGVELDSVACRTRRAAGFDTIEGDVRQHRGIEAKCLIASPPCQEWSTAGTGQSSATRAQLDAVITSGQWQTAGALDGFSVGAQLVCEPLFWAYGLALLGKPYRWIVLEQVDTVANTWAAVAEQLGRIGYHTWTGILDASWYGVPQKRRRAVLIASLEREVGEPAPWARRATIADVIEPNGFDGMMPAGRSSRGQPKLFSEPAPTQTATGNAAWVHVRDYANVVNRPSGPGSSALIRAELPEQQDHVRVSIADMTALQTFPADYPWQGARGDMARQIGNAVPPLLAEAVLRMATGV